jgi:hypothetical protein
MGIKTPQVLQRAPHVRYLSHGLLATQAPNKRFFSGATGDILEHQPGRPRIQTGQSKAAFCAIGSAEVIWNSYSELQGL